MRGAIQLKPGSIAYTCLLFVHLLFLAPSSWAVGPDEEKCHIELVKLTAQGTLKGYLRDIEPRLRRLDTLLAQNHWVPIGTPMGDPLFGSGTLFSDPTPLVGRTVFGIQTFGSVTYDSTSASNSPHEIHGAINDKLRTVPEVKLYGGRVDDVYPERQDAGPPWWYFELRTPYGKTEMVGMTGTTKAHVLTLPGEKLSERELGRVEVAKLPLNNRVLQQMGKNAGETRKIPLRYLITYVGQSILFDPQRPQEISGITDFRKFMHGHGDFPPWELRDTGIDWEVRPWILKQYPELVRVNDNLPRLRELMNESGMAGFEQWMKEQEGLFGAELEIHPLLE